jgi:hypothetical protein
MSSSGYIYCFSNPSLLGMVKVGMTTRYIEERLQEANHCGTWGPPTPYVIEFAKKVNNPREKEKALHRLLEKYSERVNTNNKQTYDRHITSDRHRQFQEINYSKYYCPKCNKKYNSHVGLYKHSKKCNLETKDCIFKTLQQIVVNFKNSTEDSSKNISN